MNKEFDNALVLDFPLRGEWMAPKSPVDKVPSHGDNRLGQRYAYDFWQVGWRLGKWKIHRVKKSRYATWGISRKKFYCYGKEVYAPCDGKIVEMFDGHRDRRFVHLISDFFIALRRARKFTPKKRGWQPIFGNYIIMECGENNYALFAHLQKHSINVALGEEVKKGKLMGKVGYSGAVNSPRLHFQIMDSSDLAKAKGKPCKFEKYEQFISMSWQTITNSMIGKKDIMRYHG